MGRAGTGEAAAKDPAKGDGGEGRKWKGSKHYLGGENQQDLEEIREEADNALGFTTDKNKELVTTIQDKSTHPQQRNSYIGIPEKRMTV